MKYQTYVRRPISQTQLIWIAKFCVRELGVTWANASSRKRGHAGITWARQVAQYICRECTGATLQQIGDVFSRDHGSVLYNCRTTQDFMESYPATRIEVEALKARVMNALLKGATDEAQKEAA